VFQHIKYSVADVDSASSDKHSVTTIVLEPLAAPVASKRSNQRAERQKEVTKHSITSSKDAIAVYPTLSDVTGDIGVTVDALQQQPSKRQKLAVATVDHDDDASLNAALTVYLCCKVFMRSYMSMHVDD